MHTPSLVAKILSVSTENTGLIFYEVWNDNCDLDLELSNSVISGDTPDDVPPNQVSFEKDQQLLRYSRNGHILIKYEPSHSNSDSDLDESNSGYNMSFYIYPQNE